MDTKALNMNLKNISRWELGHSKPSLEAAAELAKVLDVSLDYLGGLGDKSNLSALEVLLRNKMDGMSDEQKKAVKTILEAF